MSSTHSPNGLQPHTATIYKLSDTDWQTEIFTDQTHNKKQWLTQQLHTQPSLNEAANQHTETTESINVVNMLQ